MSESTDTPGQTDSDTGDTATGEPPEKMGSAPPEGESASGKDDLSQGGSTTPG